MQAVRAVAQELNICFKNYHQAVTTSFVRSAVTFFSCLRELLKKRVANWELPPLERITKNRQLGPDDVRQFNAFVHAFDKLKRLETFTIGYLAKFRAVMSFRNKSSGRRRLK